MPFLADLFMDSHWIHDFTEQKNNFGKFTYAFKVIKKNYLSSLENIREEKKNN